MEMIISFKSCEVIYMSQEERFQEVLNQLKKAGYRITEQRKLFLHIILKGGILFLIPFLVFLICAICKGFASKSYFSHQSALFLVHFIVSLYPGSPFVFCPKYLFVWVAVWSIYTNQKNNIFR